MRARDSRDTQLFHDLIGKMTSILINVLDEPAGETTETFTPVKTINQMLKEEERTCPLVLLKNEVAAKSLNMVNVLETLDEVLETCHCPTPCPCA